MLFDFLIWRLPADFCDQITKQSRPATRNRLFASLWRTIRSFFRTAEKSPPTTPERLLEQVRSRPLKALGWYLGAAKPIQTSSQVVAEIQGLAKSKLWLEGARLERFWRLARQELEQIELTDQFVSMSEVDYEDFVRYGPTDASVLWLAIRLRAAVLAWDTGLLKRCVERQISILDYDKVLELWTKHHVT